VVALLRRRIGDIGEDDARAVARLAEGSIGRALALSAEGGLDLWRDMIGLLEKFPKVDIAALHSFADKAGGEEERCRATEALFLRLLANAAGRGYRGASLEAVAGEAALGQRLLASAGLERWLALWDRTVKGFERADSVNLDRKLVVLNTFLALERALRP
jgi:DNA polymerase-3 subunit delta'